MNTFNTNTSKTLGVQLLLTNELWHDEVSIPLRSSHSLFLI